MSDSDIQVTFGAQIQGLLDGMGHAQESVKEATEGMSGSIAKMAETMATLGPAALALAAVGIAFEAIKGTIEYVAESVDKTKELAETFRTLGYATGASNADLNQYTAAMERSGGTVDDVTALMQGMVRGVKSNSDGLVLNGMAADKASLQQMTFGEYLKKASEIADNMATPLERDEFLTLAFGRAGAKCGAQLKEMQENMEKVAGTQILSPDVAVTMKALTEAEGRLKAAQQAREAQTAAMAAPVKIAYDNMKASALESINAQTSVMEMVKKGYIQITWAANDMGDHVTMDWAKMEEAARKYGEEAAKNAKLGAEDSARELMHAGGGGHYVDPKDKAPKAPKSGTSGPAVDPQMAVELDIARDNAAIKKTIDAEYEKTREDGLKAYNKAMEAAQHQEVSDARAKMEEELKIDRILDEEAAKTAKKQEEAYSKAFNNITKDWGAGVVAMLNHQLSFTDGVKKAAKDMESAFIKSIVNMGLKWAEAMLMQAILGKTAHESQNMLDAKDAYAGAYKATVGIPYVGPILAPVAGAAAFAGVMAFASGGWDNVPSDQMAMIHKNEMVMSAPLATGIRNMVASGGAASGGKGDSTTHNHYGSPSAKTIRQMTSAFSAAGKQIARTGSVR